MSEVAEEIIKKTSTKELVGCIKKLLKVFYEIMRKYGIKEGTWSSKDHIGRTVSNPEWVMCEQLFWDSFKNAIDVITIIEGDTPKDLLGY